MALPGLQQCRGESTLGIPLIRSDMIAGTVAITVLNPGPPGGGASNIANISLVNPAPFVSSVIPASRSSTLGDPAFTLTLDGSFVPGSVINIKGTNRVTK